ncbi:MAG: extracellular solute-binding protein [Firmicutes bacterium]|nr:extracellular solute-binding protein [Bacillota bacterium]
MSRKGLAITILAVLCVSLVAGAAFAAENWDEIIAKAKEEGVVVAWGTSSRLARVAPILEEQYGIKLQNAKMSDMEITERLVREKQAGINSVDFIMAEDILGVAGQLLPFGYVESWIPEESAAKLDPAYREPFVFLIQPRTILYNTEVYDECPITNLWQLTTPEWRGMVIMRDPEITSTNISFFAEIVARADEMAAAYKEYFGEEIKLTTENAGWEFIKRLAQNDVVTVASDDDVAEAVGSRGQADPPVGFATVGKVRLNVEQNLVLGVAEHIAPINGYHYPAYGLIVTDCPHPNAAKVLVRTLLTDEGMEAWTQDWGNFSTHPDIWYNPENPLGGLDVWTSLTWPLTLEATAQYSRDVLDFWILNRR